MSDDLPPKTERYVIEQIKLDQSLTAGLEDLLAEHWREVALDQDSVPLEPDYDRYRALERQGGLRALGATVRGRLVGYNVFFIQRPIHYAGQTWGINDILYVSPSARTTMVGPRLVKEAEQLLPRYGVTKVIYHAKTSIYEPGKATLTDLLLRLGYRHDENVLTKRL